MSERLLNTVVALGQLVERTGLQEAAILAQARQLIAGLVAHDDWLPDEMA
ncbi:cysteine dioxygenase, partial [Klebsiella pneumoniae]